MLPADWFYALLTQLARCSQPDNEQTWGMSDALLALAEAAHQQGDLCGITVADAITWVDRQATPMRTTLHMAHDLPSERARLAYHQGRVAACHLILLHLRTQFDTDCPDFAKLGIACEGASMTK